MYLLAATKEPEEIVAAGHVRVLVRKGGRDVVAYEPLSRGCLTLERPAESDGPAIMINHVLDDHPIETHVYLSLLTGLKLIVLTESAMWAVEAGDLDAP